MLSLIMLLKNLSPLGTIDRMSDRLTIRLPLEMASIARVNEKL